MGLNLCNWNQNSCQETFMLLTAMTDKYPLLPLCLLLDGLWRVIHKPREHGRRSWRFSIRPHYYILSRILKNCLQRGGAVKNVHDLWTVPSKNEHSIFEVLKSLILKIVWQKQRQRQDERRKTKSNPYIIWSNTHTFV